MYATYTLRTHALELRARDITALSIYIKYANFMMCVAVRVCL